MPLCGQNDGSLILPLNGCDYQDFRPVIQAAHYLVTGRCCFPPGPWDEDLLWLFGEEALNAPVISLEKKDLKAHMGGYYTLRSSDGFILIRCASFRHRPGQADMLHADLWWKGQNIALDPGTYSYSNDPPWDNPLSHTTYHNSVTVDGFDQMKRVSRFVWLPWISARVLRYQESPGKQLVYWEGEHTGYKLLKQEAIHRRGILRLGKDHWLFLHALCSQGKHEKSPRGWRSPYYNYQEPALSLDLVEANDNAYFRTLFGPEDCKVSCNQNVLQIEGNAWDAMIRLQFEAKMSLIQAASIKGISEDTIEIPQ